jgi:oligopeptidase B
METGTLRSHQAFRHQIGSSQKDVLVYTEDDEMFHVSVEKTADNKYLLIESASHLSSETYFVDADTPKGVVIVLKSSNNRQLCSGAKQNSRSWL